MATISEWQDDATETAAGQMDEPTVTSVVMQALRVAGLPVTSLGVAQVADALLGSGCRIAGVERRPDGAALS